MVFQLAQGVLVARETLEDAGAYAAHLDRQARLSIQVVAPVQPDIAGGDEPAQGFAR